jgi:hypothetical protein
MMMNSSHSLLSRIGTMAFTFGAILAAQPGTISKWGPNSGPPHNHRAASCTGCVRDLDGRLSSNPAPVRAFRSTHPCPANGSLKGPCPGYLVDHVKPLDRGGADTVRNMRWRKIAQAKEHPK